MPSPAVNRALEGATNPGLVQTVKRQDPWPARDARSMSPTRTMPVSGALNKINIVIDSFIAPDRSIEVDENFVRERLYSDEKLHLSENSDNNLSPTIKPRVSDKISSNSSNPDLDEFAFNKNWGKHAKFGAMPPPNEIFRQSTFPTKVSHGARIQRRS